MYAKRFLHKLLGSVIHLGRLNGLILAVLTVIKTKQLQLTALGRALEHPIQERCRIRKIDRLLGNKNLQNDAEIIYKEITTLLIGNKTRPIIIADWTKLPNCNWYALRAALATEGRALTLYEKIYPKKLEGNPKVHSLFIKKLKKFLPSDCKPIIVTDAGFKNPWFKEVLSLGWDFVGRIRGLTKYSEDGKYFESCKELHALATDKIKYLGEKIFARKNPLKLSCYLVKQKLKGRKKLTKKGSVSKHKDSIDHGKSKREPWLLVSSLKGFEIEQKVFKIYKRRMTIEEGFRDLKSRKYGFSLLESKTINVERYIILLLIALLGSLVAWLVGKLTEETGMHYQYQANSIKHRRVLSFFYLGCQVLRDSNKISLSLSTNNIFNVCQYLEVEFNTI